MVMSKIVEATGVSVGSLNPLRKERAKQIEEVMSQAVLEATEAGITDPIEIRKKMDEARQKVTNG